MRLSLRAQLCCIALIAPAGIGACHDTVSIPALPEGFGAFVVTPSPDSAAAWAIGGSAAEVPPFAARAPRIAASAFECSLPELGLGEGTVTLLAEPTELRLPHAAELFELEAEASTWVVGPASDGVLQRLPLDADHLCTIGTPRYDTQGARFGFEAESDGVWLNFAFARDDVVIVGTERGALYALSPTGMKQRLPRVPGVAPYLSGFVRADGEVWLVASDGTIARGDPSAGLELIDVKTSTKARIRASVVGPRGNEPFELFAAFDPASFHRFDPSERRWTELSRGPDRGPISGHPSVVWIRSGEAVAVGVSPMRSELAWFKDGSLEHLPIPRDLGLPRTVQYVEGLGVVLITASGDALTFADGQLEPHSKFAPLPFEGTFPLIIADGLLTLVRLGEGPTAEAQVPGKGGCPIEVFSTRVATQVAMLGDDVFAGLRTSFPEEGAYAVFSPLEKRIPACLRD